MSDSLIDKLHLAICWELTSKYKYNCRAWRAGVLNILENNLGDASTRKDEAVGVSTATVPEISGTSSLRSEISDNDLIELMCQAAWGTESSTKKTIQASIMEDALQAIRHYLRSPVPVSVDLEKCAIALMRHHEQEGHCFYGKSFEQLDRHNKANLRDGAKAVLDTAGVKYE